MLRMLPTEERHLLRYWRFVDREKNCSVTCGTQSWQMPLIRHFRCTLKGRVGRKAMKFPTRISLQGPIVNYVPGGGSGFQKSVVFQN